MTITIADFIDDCDLMLKRLDSPKVRNNTWYVVGAIGAGRQGNAADVPGWVQDMVAEALEVSNTEMPPVSLAEVKAVDSLEKARWLITTLRKWAVGLQPSAAPIPVAEKTQSDEVKLDERAAAAKALNPKWTDKQVADEIGCIRETLFKPYMVKYKQVKAALKSERERFRRGRQTDRRHGGNVMYDPDEDGV